MVHLHITDTSLKYVGIVGLCQKASGTIEDPDWARVHVFKADPSNGAWSTITGSPFPCSKVQAQTGLFGRTLDRSALSAASYMLYFEVQFNDASKTGGVGSFIISEEGQGVNTVTITWKRTGSSDVLVGRRLSFRKGSYNLFTKTTNEQGQIIVGLPNGEYTLQPITTPNYDDDNPDPTPWTLTVVGTTLMNVSSAVRIVEPPVYPNLCRVNGFIYTPAAQPVVGAIMKAKLIGGPYFSASAGVVVTEQQATTDSNGYFYIDLTKSDDLELSPGGDGRQEYKLTVVSIGFEKLVTIPNVASIGYDQL